MNALVVYIAFVGISCVLFGVYRFAAGGASIWAMPVRSVDGFVDCFPFRNIIWAHNNKKKMENNEQQQQQQ